MRELIQKIGNLYLLFFLVCIYYVFTSVSLSSMSVTNAEGFAKAIFFAGVLLGFRSLIERDGPEFVHVLFGLLGLVGLGFGLILFFGSFFSKVENPYIQPLFVLSLGLLSVARS